MSETANEKYLDKDEEIRRLRSLLEQEKIKHEREKIRLEKEKIRLEQEKLQFEEQIEAEKNKRKEAEKKTQNAFNAVGGIFKQFIEAVKNTRRINEEICKVYISNFDGVADEAVQALQTYTELINQAINNLAKYQSMLYVEGNEKIEKKKVEEAVKSLNDLQRGAKFESKSFGRIYLCIENLSEDKLTGPELKPFLQLIRLTRKSRSLESKAKPAKQTHRGRVINRGELPSRNAPLKHLEQPGLCPKCHTDLVSLGDRWEELKTAAHVAIDNAFPVFVEKHGHQIFYCSKCGKYVAQFDEQEDHPILPGREISTNTIIDLTHQMYLGMPVERAGKNFERLAKLGSNTINYSEHEYAQVYLKPLYEALLRRLKTQPMIYSDETTWHCLQDQGKGKIPKELPPAETRSKNYVLALGTVADNPTRINLYHYMKTRSAKEISSIITKDFEFKTLITDGYAAYETVMKDHSNAKHQACLVHLRRALLDAMRLDQFVKDAQKLSDDALEKLILDDLKKGNPSTKLVTVLFALSNIFNYERIKRQNPEGSTQYTKSHDCQKELFSKIDLQLLEIANDRVTQKGSQWTCKKGDAIGKACVYYLNNRKSLQTFLSDPKIPIDTNPIERLIRTIACYRKSCWFKHSPEYTQSMCIIMSIYATLQANGVEDPTKWLRIYSTRLYKHILESALYLTDKACNPDDKTELLKKRIRKTNSVPGGVDKDSALTVENLIKGFDFDGYVASILATA